MDILYIISIAFALAVDAFSLSVAAGASIKQCDNRAKFRLSFHIGLFHFLMPVIGFLAGSEFVEFISDYDHWVALGLLSLVGSKMIVDSRKADGEISDKDITKGAALISVTIATSIDSLAVGFTYGMTENSILIPALIFALVTGLVALFGIYLGEKLSIKYNNSLSLIGGVVLILIGIHIVLTHLEII